MRNLLPRPLTNLLAVTGLAMALLVQGLPPAAADGLELLQGEREAMPELRFSGLDGNESSLAAFRGKVVVLNLWATWCVPCREEMPALDRLQAMFSKDEVVVLALSLDRGDNAKVEKFLGEVGVKNLSIYRDAKGAAARTLRVPGLPATILVDRQGREAGRKLGIEQWDGEAAVSAVKALLAEEVG
jgi:thiol-disulfide isomerase/thioredoxin